MLVHSYASRSHYQDHLAPVWAALPPDARGTTYDRLPRVLPGGLWLVASAVDAQRLRGARYVYLEHGAGQAYQGDPASATSGSYAGGHGHQQAGLFLAPSEAVADRWRATYPGTPAVVVGCPRLDRWLPGNKIHNGATVAVTFHWPCPLVPETQWALPAYRAHLGELSEALRGVGGRLVGHAHPRARRQLAAVWGRLGVEVVDDLGWVYDHADLLVADNTSALYEACAIGLPTVVLNAPWYRRHVEHGLRFWSHPPGPMVDTGPELVPAVLAELADPRVHAGMRAAAAGAAYAHLDGCAAERAATAIMEVL